VPNNKHFLLKKIHAGVLAYFPTPFSVRDDIQIKQQIIPFSDGDWDWLKTNYPPDKAEIDSLMKSLKNNDRWFAAARLDYQPTIEQVKMGLTDIMPTIRARWMMRDDWALTQEIFESHLHDITVLSLLKRKDIQKLEITSAHFGELRKDANEFKSEALFKMISYLESEKLKTKHFDVDSVSSSHKMRVL
jgi:hypothetical protein